MVEAKTTREIVNEYKGWAKKKFAPAKDFGEFCDWMEQVWFRKDETNELLNWFINDLGKSRTTKGKFGVFVVKQIKKKLDSPLAQKKVYSGIKGKIQTCEKCIHYIKNDCGNYKHKCPEFQSPLAPESRKSLICKRDAEGGSKGGKSQCADTTPVLKTETELMPEGKTSTRSVSVGDSSVSAEDTQIKGENKMR